MTIVCCCQIAPRVGDPVYNRALTIDAIAGAVALGAAIIVLPELAAAGYMFTSHEEVTEAALRSDHELFNAWSDALRPSGSVVIGGFVESGEAGAVYNSAAVVDGSGVLAVYRKTHLWDRELEWFAAGSEPPPIVETDVGRIGVAVCYDLEFPEVSRYLARGGAELIAVPTNWPLVARPAGERPPEVVIAMAMARINRVAIACCDRTGTERGQRWTEGSLIVSAEGWPSVEAGDGERHAAADIDLSCSSRKRLSDRNDALADRRPELYGTW